MAIVRAIDLPSASVVSWASVGVTLTCGCRFSNFEVLRPVAYSRFKYSLVFSASPLLKPTLRVLPFPIVAELVVCYIPPAPS